MSTHGRYFRKVPEKNFRYLLTGDESWFCYFTPHGCQWVHEDDQVPYRVRPNIQNPKIMITIFWNINGIAILDVLKKGTHMNSTIFISNILEPLTKYPQFVEAKKSRKKFYIHFDNCPSHRAKQTLNFLAQKKFDQVPHPKYSPDLALSDFYLFGKIEDKLEGVVFGNEDELKERIVEEFQKISKDELKSVFDGWIARCYQCISTGGEYI